MRLFPLPAQPDGLSWPAEDWPASEPPEGGDRDALGALLDATFTEPQPEETARTHDLLIVHRGRLVAERYAPEFGPRDTQPSWSIAKSMLHAVVGILVKEGRLDVAAPAPVPQWQRPGDRRAQITLDAMLHMTPGLRFVEDYVADKWSDVIAMLRRPGQDDMAAFAAGFPADHPPDTVFNYSSGTSAIISGIVKGIVGGGDRYLAFLRRSLFERIGIASAIPKFDRSGAWIASSYCFCTPRDFARFGLLYLRDGIWEGERILPAGWVDYARTPAPAQPEGEHGYGAHWWLANDDLGTFMASGYAGQHLLLIPALDLIILRNGDTPAVRGLDLWMLYVRIIDLFRTVRLQP